MGRTLLNFHFQNWISIADACFYCFASRASRVCSNFDQKRELNVLISGRGRKWDGRTKVWWESLRSTQPTLASHPPIVGGFCFTLPALGPSHRQESEGGASIPTWRHGHHAQVVQCLVHWGQWGLDGWTVLPGLRQETAGLCPDSSCSCSSRWSL